MKNKNLAIPFLMAEARIATTLRNVDFSQAHSTNSNLKPKVGDIVIAQVEAIGDKKFLQNANGRDEELNTGDFIAVAYGERYATQEYEALLPVNQETCHLVSGGGIAARIVPENSNWKAPTIIHPKGILCNDLGEALNLKQFTLKPEINGHPPTKPAVIAVLGTGMDAGKTTTAASTIKGLVAAGHKVGFGKVTGTGLSSDLWQPIDAGASAAYDFVDMGYPATYQVPTSELKNVMDSLINLHASKGCDTVVLEIADGIFQQDNVKLLAEPSVKNTIDGVILAADGVLGALMASQNLTSNGYKVLAVSGVATSKPLAVIEIEENMQSAHAPLLGCLTKEQLTTPETGNAILSRTKEQQTLKTAAWAVFDPKVLQLPKPLETRKDVQIPYRPQEQRL